MTNLEIGLLVALFFMFFCCWSINRSFKIVAKRSMEYAQGIAQLRAQVRKLQAEITLYQSGATKEEVEKHFQIQAEMNAANMDHSHNGGVI